jgi:ABC-type spermidine/putrescine transport system permease subunit II
MKSISRFFDNRNVLGLLFMLPAAALLLVFLTYPLGLGVWLGFTDTKVGRAGGWIGIENYEFLVTDSVFTLSVFNTFVYTVVASVIKFILGLWLALLLNKHIPFKSFVRAIVLLPFIVPTVLSAIAFWWIYHTAVDVRSCEYRRGEPLAAVLVCHAAHALADHRGGHDFLGLVHLYRFPVDLGADPRRADQCHTFDGHAFISAGDPRWGIG